MPTQYTIIPPAISALSAGTSAPAGAVNSGGTLCQSHHSSGKNATKKTRKRGESVIRPDYRRDVRWTYAEAANFAGPCVTIASVRRWAARGMFRPGFLVGPLKVDAFSFIKFLETKRPQP